MISDHYGVCFVKIGQVVPELCASEISHNKNAIQNVWGSKFSKKCIAFEAPRTFASEFNFRESVSYIRVI